MKLYLLQRKDKNGFKETIWAWQRCKGWKTIEIRNVEFIHGEIAWARRYIK